ncbi:hypothetical protein UFOVP153_26 [uncultured Caudovirales phage]|uniref:Uncharacterized protein n=1 Tax=uncultured Caudovirales phage TaxID=2100421 RepID=A0A6J5KY69_9CAUD|nr:hypothetical protein UFOVP69_32 [uncultured Caudovirales phage]CAB5170535.1 hypothetical protein UFOVP153_26 [uncultured Caudovirales phage]
MTPKEKANDLCMMFLIKTTTDIPYGVNKTIAKECALIAIDEITSALDKNLDASQFHVMNYWQEVKEEIDSL